MINKIMAMFRRKPKMTQTLSAKVIRADGTVEDLGVISQTKSKGWGVKA